MQKDSTRLEYVDTAKFLVMFLVILCHTAGRGNLIHASYTFHLPVFFVLNGITLRVKEGETFGNYLERKLKSYLIPIFCLGILSAFVDIIMSYMGTNPLTIKHVGSMFIQLMEQKRVYPLWFVGALLFSDIFFYFVVKFSKNKIIPLTLIGFLFLGVAIFCNTYYRYRYVWNIDVSLFGVFFVFVGYAFSHEKLEKIKTFLLKKRWISLIFGVLLMFVGQILGEYNFYKFNLFLDMWSMNYSKYYLAIPCAVLSSLGVVLISNAVTNKFLGVLGKTTIVLLAFHQLLTIPIFNKIFENWRASILPLDPNSFKYLLYHLTSTLFSITILSSFYYALCYSPFAFVLNKKMPNFYKKLFQKIKLSKKKA